LAPGGSRRRERWLTLAEIFPSRIRGAAMAAAVFALRGGNLLLACLFLPFLIC
jgi:hypothetical protein